MPAEERRHARGDVAPVDSTSEEVERYERCSTAMSGDRPELSPFDIVGDVHGCGAELELLLGELGWHVERDGAGARTGASPCSSGTWSIAARPAWPCCGWSWPWSRREWRLPVPGNHDVRLAERLLAGPDRPDARTTRGSAVEAESASSGCRVARFVDSLPGHLRLDEGRLIVAHAGLQVPARTSPRPRGGSPCSASTPASVRGKLIRRDWAGEYRGAARVVIGHTRVCEPSWRNRTLNIDTGCAGAAG